MTSFFVKDVSIIIILRAGKFAKNLYNLVEIIKQQIEETKTLFHTELVLIHESNTPREAPKEFAWCVYRNIPEKRGFAYNRNCGLDNSSGEICVFTDDDCIPQKNWLKNMLEPFTNEKIMGVMGNISIPKSNYLGNCISELGFPGGGNAGYRNMWKTDKNDFTDHLSTCTAAIRREVFTHLGKFNNSLIYGTEEGELSYRMAKAGMRIKFQESARVYHLPRDKFISFIKWQIRRGRANYYFKKVVGNISVQEFLKLRLWSCKNIFKKNILSPKIIGISILLFLSIILQQVGYISEKRKEKRKKQKHSSNESSFY